MQYRVRAAGGGYEHTIELSCAYALEEGYAHSCSQHVVGRAPDFCVQSFNHAPCLPQTSGQVGLSLTCAGKDD